MSISSISSDKVTLFKLKQKANVESSIFLILFGIVIDVRLEQL